jgi:hypothetical protein
MTGRRIIFYVYFEINGRIKVKMTSKLFLKEEGIPKTSYF